MKKAYESVAADRLIPLLRSVQRELRERADAVRVIENKLRRARRAPEGDATRSLLEAELATHKLEVRQALRELARLGCALDQEQPGRILIPGRTGELADGFTWSFGESVVRAQVANKLG